MKKYFFFDIDGTLTDLKTHQIVPSAKIALEKLKQAGHFVCLNTGRAHYKAEKARLEFNFEHMVWIMGVMGLFLMENWLKIFL